MNDTIQKYIIDERARGVADSAIKEALLAQGWKKEDVEGAFMVPATPMGNKFTGGMFVGRLSRAKYILILISIFIPILLISLYIIPLALLHVGVWLMYQKNDPTLLYILITGFFLLLLLIHFIGATVRRLHDTGSSGWWTLLFFVNPLGLILSVYLCFKKGDVGGNKYGSMPNDNVSFWQALRGS